MAYIRSISFQFEFICTCYHVIQTFNNQLRENTYVL